VRGRAAVGVDRGSAAKGVTAPACIGATFAGR
jgi:hypothetical protein